MEATKSKIVCLGSYSTKDVFCVVFCENGLECEQRKAVADCGGMTDGDDA